jgi:predicted nucleotidyltransferase
LEWGEDQRGSRESQGDKKMDWKTKQITKILGVPKLNTEYLQPHVIISLKERVAKINNVGALILYGSIVRGEASAKSDIDVMVVPLKKKNVKNLKKRVSKILKQIEDEHRLKVSFSLMIPTGSEDSYFMWETLKDGAVIYIRPELALDTMGNARPYALIAYSYSDLKENDKKKVQRFLFDSKSGMQMDKGNKMEYIAKGVILLPQKRSKKVTEYFEKMQMQYSLLKVWR